MKYTLSEKHLISDAIAKYPGISAMLAEYGLVCVNCPLNHFETIEEGAQLHGMSDAEIKKMISEINIQIQSENK